MRPEIDFKFQDRAAVASFSPNVLQRGGWDIGVDSYIMYVSDFSFQ